MRFCWVSKVCSCCSPTNSSGERKRMRKEREKRRIRQTQTETKRRARARVNETETDRQTDYRDSDILAMISSYLFSPIS